MDSLNPVVTSAQLETSASQLDGVSKDLEEAVQFETARLLQAAGVLLRLPQEIIARAIVILFRFWTGPDGGSLLEHDAKDVAAACLYLTAKPSARPVSPRRVLVAFEYLSTLPSKSWALAGADRRLTTSWQLTEGHCETARERLYTIELQILRLLGFQTRVSLPHPVCLNYMLVLDGERTPSGSMLARAALRELNSALVSPQRLYLTHQPSALATAAIYLAAKKTGVKLPEVDWWEVFDVDREELGFLVAALTSLEGFARAQKRRWTDGKVPLTSTELQAEMAKQRVNQSV